MASLFDRQKFKSELMSRGITWTNDEIDSYMDSMNLGAGSKPKSYLPYKQQALTQAQSPGMYEMPALEDPLMEPTAPENAALDFVGNLVWEAFDVGTFGALGALDYDDYLENIVTGGGPGTFAGRVGAGLGGLAGFLPPMRLIKGAAGAAVKGLSTYGTKQAAKTMVQKGANALGRTKYSKLDKASQDAIWKPFTDTLGQYGHSLENLATREKFLTKLNNQIRPIITKTLKAAGINPSTKVISKVEEIVRTSMGAAEGAAMPIWNLQQRIAVALGGSAGAGKIASVASHVIEEAAVFAAVETPMEIMNSIDEFRDPDIPGTIGHAVTLGSALGLIRFIPGGRDMPIMKSAFHRLTKMFQNKQSLRSLDYGTKEARTLLEKSALSMYKADKEMFNVAVGSKGLEKLGLDRITSASTIKELSKTQKGSEILSDAIYQIEKNWSKRWWPEFMKNSLQDLGGSFPRMAAGAMAFNWEIVFDDHVPLEDKVFNILVGAFMTKRGRALDFIDANGKRVAWKHTQRPWTYDNKLQDISKYLRILGTDSPSLIFDSMLRENEQLNELIALEDTADMQSVMNVMEKHKVLVSSEEKRKPRKKPESATDHELYDYIRALSGLYVHTNTDKRMLGVDELSLKQLKAIERDLSKIELVSKTGEGGLITIADMEDVAFDASKKDTEKLIDLYKTVVKDMYAVIGAPELKMDDMVVAQLNASDIAALKKPEAKVAMAQLQQVRDLLGKYEIISVSQITKQESAQRVPEGREDAIIGAMNRLENDLHQLIYKGEPIHGEYAPKIGEEFLDNVIHKNAIYMSIRDSHSKLQTLGGAASWKPNPRTGRVDTKHVNDLISDLFTDELGVLSQRVIVSEDISKKLPEDYESIQEFANTVLGILPYSTNYRSPTGFGTSETKTVSYSEMKELRRMFKDNGMGGFAFKGDDLHMYINEFKGYAIDRKVSSAVRTDGKPFSGLDRAKIGTLIQTGLVNEKMEVIDIVREVNALINLTGDPEVMSKLMDYNITHSSKGMTLTGDIIEALFPEASLDMKEQTRNMLIGLEQYAKTMGVELPEVVTNLHAKYQQHIEPYILREGKGILDLRTDIVAEAPLGTMHELVAKLDMVDQQVMRESHRSLMETIERYSNRDGITEEQQQFINKIRNDFWNRTGETAKIVSLLANYGHTSEEGDFIPLYNRETKELDLEFAGAKEEMMKAFKAMDQYIPSRLRSELVEQKVRELSKEKLFESDNSNTISSQSFIKEYNLALKDKEWLAKTLEGPDPLTAIKSAGAHFADASGNKRFFDDMTVTEQGKLIDDVIRLSLTIGEGRTLKRLTVGQGYGVHADFDNTVTNNPLFRFLDDILGYGNYSIVGREVEMGIGKRDSRTDQKAMNALVERLSKGGAASDVQMRAEQGADTVKMEAMEGHIFMGIGDYSWGIAIPESKAEVLYNKFGEFITTKEGDYKGQYKSVFKQLKRIQKDKGEDVLDDDGNVISRVYKSSDSEGDSFYAEQMATIMWMDKMAGEVWWDHLAATTGKNTRESAAAVSKWAKRIRLMSNISAKELSDAHVDRVVSLHKTHGTLEKESLTNLSALQKNKGLNTIIVRDEGDAADMFSTMDKVLKQINDENAAGAMTMSDRDDIRSDKTVWDGNKKRADASIADSVMIMPLKWFKALQTISGFGSMGNIGGIKPLISSTGDAVLFGKTAILPDTRFDGFFKKNKKVHAILMDSGAKIKNKNINVFDTAGKDFASLKNDKIKQEDYIVHLPWKSINTGSAVSSDHSATISYQLTNEMNAGHSNSFYDWLIADNVEKYDKVMARFSNTNNSIGSTAFARTLKEPGTGDNAALSVMDMWLGASNGGGPVHFTGVLPILKNSIKKKFLDNGLLQLHNDHGSQSVMSPFLGDNWNELRNTTFKGRGADRSIWTYGQAQISNVNIHKTVNLERLNFVDHMDGARDALLSFSEIKKTANFKKAIKNVTNNQRSELAPKEELGFVYEVVQEWNKITKSNREIALVFHRTPSTRQSDKIIVGLKGFTKAAEGNQARLNAWDTFARAEADFDIDKINYWWDTPDDILRLWRDQSGKTPFVSEEPMISRTTLDNNYDWLNPQSMRQMSTDIAHAEKMRGQVVKAQRIVQFLSQYNSTDDAKGFTLDLSGGFRPAKMPKENDTRIVFDFEKLDANRHLLAEDIQRIIDSQNGYHKELYTNDWLDKFLFGDGGARYEGLFKKEVYQTDPNLKYGGKGWQDYSTIDNVAQPSLGKAEREIIKAVISPYRSLLQVGTSIYEGGEAKSPRYDDLIERMQTYDSQMGRLPSRVYHTLKYKFGNPKSKEYDENVMTRVDEIFKKNDFNPLGEFGSNAKTQMQVGPNGLKVDSEAQRKLPFERMLATVANGEYLSQDSPRSLWGDELGQFENFYNELMGAGRSEELRTNVYKTMAGELKDDMKRLKFLNFLRWKEGQQNRSLNNAKKDGYMNQADRIATDLAETTSLRMEIEGKIVNEEGTIKAMLDVAVNRYSKEIFTYPQSHRVEGVPRFENNKKANSWIKNNKKVLYEIASKKPIKYRAINSPEYRDALIFHEMLSKYENIFIDPGLDLGRRFEDFNEDLRSFDTKRREMWKMFFGDKKRIESFEPWWNETRIMNTLTNEFNGLFDKWNAVQPGLGELFLWKTMLPRPIKGEYTYFNGKLAPAFRESDMSMVKFGLRFVANADASRMSNFKARMIFDVFTSQYTDWYDFLYSNKRGGKEGMTYRDMYEQYSRDLYDNPSPLIDFAPKGKPTQAQDLNDIVKSMFGAQDSYSYGFVMLDPKSAGAIKARTQHHVFPRGYIPINYRGGEHPRIQGWSDWNRAREGEAYLMLGESLSKKILGYREQPIIKHTFNEVNGKSETQGDMKTIIKEKVQHEENSFNPDC